MYVVLGLYRAARAPGSSANAPSVNGGVPVFVGAVLIFCRFFLRPVVWLRMSVLFPLYAVPYAFALSCRRCSSRSCAPAPLRPCLRVDRARVYCNVVTTFPQIVSLKTLTDGQRYALTPAPHSNRINKTRGT